MGHHILLWIERRRITDGDDTPGLGGIATSRMVVVTSPMGDSLARFNEAGGLEITPPEMLGATMSVFEKSD